MNYISKQLEDAIMKALKTPGQTSGSAVAPGATIIPTDNGEHDKEDPRVTSQFGNRELEGKEQFHAGVDLSAAEGSSVYALYDGTVTKANYQDQSNHGRGAGLFIVIAHKEHVTSTYMHLSRALVSYGDKVVAGQKIALSGNTGHSTGPHLHLEVRVNGSPRQPTSSEISTALRGKQ